MRHDDWLAAFPRPALAAAVLVLAAAPALAQNTTAAVSGRVTGGDGAPLAGATVTLLHVESGSTNTTSTDAEGRWAARGLRAGGPYTITVSRGGTAERREGVFLALAETLALDLQLGGSVVTVTGRGVSDRFSSSAMGSGTALGSREIAAYASANRNLQDYARLDPRLAQTDKERGEISASGQNTRFNSITIDGVTINDTFGLEANNLPTVKQPITMDAIQSVQVNLSNYDVTQKGYTGANINAVTKSGTNEFRGSVYFAFSNEDYVGRRYKRATDSSFAPPDFKRTTKGFTLGGPIVKDRLFFFGSYEEFENRPPISNPTFGPLGGSLTNVGITQNAIDQAIAIARNTWGLDIGGSALPQGLRLTVKDTLLKLDWNISDEHRANLRYTKTEQTDPQLNGFSTTGLSLSSWWFDQVKSIETVVAQWFADWTPTFSTELKVSQRDYESVPVLKAARMPAVGLRFSGALPPGSPAAGVNANNRFLNFGTENSRHFNRLATDTTDAYAGATLNLGAHEIKFGADHVRNETFNAFVQNTFGNYTFGCEPGTYSFGTLTDCNGAGVTAAQRELATLENFQRGLPSAYTLQAPLPGRTIEDAAASWSYANTGLFVQDTFKLTPAFSLMLGVRVDQLSVPSRPVANAAAAAPRVAGSVNGNTVVRDSGGFGLDNTVTLDNTELIQPRLGFNWRLGGETRRMQLRGGAGLFQGAAALVWLSNPFSNSGAAVASLSCSSFGACQTANARFSPNPDAPPTLTGTPPAATVDFLSTRLEQPSVWKANLAFESELPELPVVGRLVAGAEWLHTKVKSGIYYQHLNLGGPTASGTDGRQLFYTPQTYSVNCWSGSNFVTTAGTPCAGGRFRALSNPAFSNASSTAGVLLAEKTDKGGGDQITLSLAMPTGPAGVSWSLAYTRTTAKEVSPLTSSTSNSNWSNRNIFNPNEEVLQNSNYLIRDRFNASVAFSRALVGSYRTTLGLFYEGRRGKPYSWTYINDLNGDGISGNDLMYIPSGPGSGEVTFRGGAAEEARFWAIVEGNKGLAGAKGGLVGRNDIFAPWVNNFDVRVSQELPGFTSKHKASIALDILNFGNLLNRKWGRINEIGFPSNRSFVNFNGLDAQGRYIYSLGSLEDLVTRQERGESQWSMQVTLRYEF
jgi:hypothetical protein